MNWNKVNRENKMKRVPISFSDQMAAIERKWDKFQVSNEAPLNLISKRLQPEICNQLLDKAHTEMKNGNLEKAITIVNQVIETAGEVPPALFLRGLLYRMINNNKDAVNDLYTFLHIVKPDSRMKDTLAKAQLVLAEIALDDNDIDSCLSMSQAAYSNTKGDPEIVCLIAYCFWTKEMIDESIKHLKIAADLDSLSWEAYWGLALCAQKKSDAKSVLEYSLKAVERGFGDKEELDVSGIQELLTKDDFGNVVIGVLENSAEELLKETQQANEEADRTLSLLNKANAAIKNGNLDDAIIILSQVIKENGDIPQALFIRGQLLKKTNRNQEAITDLNKFILIAAQDSSLKDAILTAQKVLAEIALENKNIGQDSPGVFENCVNEPIIDTQQSIFSPGTKVSHPVFGQGTVIEFKMQEMDFESSSLIVDFDTKGQKRLMLKYAVEAGLKRIHNN